MKISIIIPVFNAEDTIRRAIESIDTTHHFEIICVNDGSTDHTLDVLKELEREKQHFKIINQDNHGAATSRNVGLEALSDDSDGFLFLDADDQFLPKSIDKMINHFEKQQEVDIVVGQLVRHVKNEWQPISTHEEINHNATVSLAESPALLQSIGPGAKLFSSKFKDLRFDEDVTFCEEHTFVSKAFLKARDIQIIPTYVYGYHESEGSVTQIQAENFLPYLKDAQIVRSRVMEILLLINEKTYYSYRMDNLIVSYLIQGYLKQYPKLTVKIIQAITDYIKDMQHTHYSGEALFRIIQAVEQGSTGWNKDTYTIWRQTLIEVGIGRPKQLFIFKNQILPKKMMFKSKQRAKKLINR